MRTRSGKFRTRFMVLLTFLALAASACQSATMTLTEIEVTRSQDQDDNVDEIVVHTLAWRTTVGEAGSTSVTVLPIGDGITVTAAEGQTVPVPTVEGEGLFTNISPLTLDGLNAGEVAEIIGVYPVVYELDGAPDVFAQQALMDQIAAELESRLVGAFEPLTPNTGSSIAHLNQLNDALDAAFFPDGKFGANTFNRTSRLLFQASPIDGDFYDSGAQARVVVDSQLAQVFSGFGSNLRGGGPLVAGTEQVDMRVSSYAGTADARLYYQITL